MRLGKFALIFIGSVSAVSLSIGLAHAQTATRGTQPATRGTAAASTQVHGNLAQVMRGILYPASNIIFFVQDKDPTGVKPEGDPATAVNPLASSYGGWQAVENSAIALAESANLLTIPGRKCANGKPVPLQNADWAKFVQGLRDAGMTVYKAAQTKNQDKMLEAADVMTTACSNCHDRYREKPNLADRCQ
jgi:hypothetical protein